MDDRFARFHHAEPVARDGFEIGRIVFEQLLFPDAADVDRFLPDDLFLEPVDGLVLLAVLLDEGSGGDDAPDTKCQDDDGDQEPVEKMETAFVALTFVFAIGGFVHVRLRLGRRRLNEQERERKCRRAQGKGIARAMPRQKTGGTPIGMPPALNEANR